MRWIWAGFLGMACGGDKDPTDSGAEADADTDADTDSDTDVDTDADSDTDTDTEPTGDTSVAATFTISSPDFASSAGDPLAPMCDWVLPRMFSCDGPNPEIAWADPPAGTVAYALIFDDPDAGDFPHWAIFNIPASETGLARGISGGTVDPHVLPTGAIELQNGAGTPGYFGSCPPAPHVYRWRLWALDAEISPGMPTFGAVESEANAHSLGTAAVCHIFRP